MADWKRIKKEYIAGEGTYKELSEKHGVSFSSLTKIARRERWRKLRQKAEEKADNDVVRKVGARNAKLDRATDLAIDAVCDILAQGKGRLRASDVKDCVSAIKALRDLKGIRNEADVEEQRARIDALRARVAAAKIADEDEDGGVIVLSPVDDAPRGDEDG